jgi:GNAT superfamily N-acetyltransferase
MNRLACEADLPFLSTLSSDVSPSVLLKQVTDGRLLLIQVDGQPIGVIKFYVLWETLPFIEVILLLESMRRRGYGTEAVREWEQEMLARGFDCALISTQVDETAQHFWRKLGYADCGSFSVRGKPSELFMQRALK